MNAPLTPRIRRLGLALLAALALGVPAYAQQGAPPIPAIPAPTLPPAPPLPPIADIGASSGAKLILTDTLASDATIDVDQDPAAHIRVTMDGNDGCLSTAGGSSMVVSTAGCGGSAGALHITMPPNVPIILTQSGDGDVRIGDTHALLVATLNGGGDLRAGHVGSLILAVHGSGDVSVDGVDGMANLDMTSSGDVRLGTLHGDLTLKHEGRGDLAIGDITASLVNIDSGGSGDMLIGAGSVGRLDASLRGAGDLGMAATLRDGDVSAAGNADVKLGKVTGTLRKQQSGDSEIYVGGPALIDTVMGDVAREIGHDHSHHNAVSITYDHGSAIGHLLTFIFVCFVLYIVWRILRRSGGLSDLAGRRNALPKSPPRHPGVVAVCDTMSRLEQRLGRVETYVTSREFDLQQKFRKL
jgi:hypothetical protein